MSEVFWCDPGAREHKAFNSLDQIYNIDAEVLTNSKLSNLYKANFANINYFVKCYHQAGRNLRKYIGRSRIASEWKNLEYFSKLGIAIPKLIAYGQKSKYGLFERGVLVTQECVNTQDLLTMLKTDSAFLRDRAWLLKVMQQVADYTRLLHANSFIHNDLKWRNILVSQDHDPKVYFIDCPLGRKRSCLTLPRGIIKDLACLDKKAKYALSKTMRLRFYYMYQQIDDLTPKHKRQLRKILKFFLGRE